MRNGFFFALMLSFPSLTTAALLLNVHAHGTPMIATKDSFEPSTLRGSATEDGHSTDALPGSRRVFVPGKLHPDLRVPMRQIELAPTRSYTGAVEANEPVRVYDCSGP